MKGTSKEVNGTKGEVKKSSTVIYGRVILLIFFFPVPPFMI